MSKETKNFLLCILTTIILVIFDQFTKYLAVLKLSDGPVPILPGVLSFTLLQGGNRGAAFGMLQGGFWIFMVITLIITVLLLVLLKRIPAEKKYMPLNITFSFILAGAIGNCIDRVISKITTGISSVTDFIYIDLINFPIFNVADICVTIGAVLLIILILFVYKDEDFGLILKKNE